MDVEGFQDGVYVLTPEVGEDGEFASLESDLGLHGAVVLDLRASASGEFDELLEVLEVPLGSFRPARPRSRHISASTSASAGPPKLAPSSASWRRSMSVPPSTSKRAGMPRTSTGRPRFEPEIGLPDAANASPARRTMTS